MKLRWFLSGTVRQAIDMSKHSEKLLNAQRDILAPQAVGGVEAALKQVNDAIDMHANDELLKARLADLETAAGQWLKPYPHADWRENVEVFLVAIVVAMAIRTFFLQPFKIPTGSMQPTLYGVTTTNCISDPNFKMPGFGTRIFDACVYGRFYHQILAEDDGQVIGIGPQVSGSRFINRQSIEVQ